MMFLLEFLEFLAWAGLALAIPFVIFVICPFLLAWLVGYMGGAR